MVTENDKTPVINVDIQLSMEHFEAIRYLLENCIRMESITREHHKKMMSYGEEILETGEKAFLGHYHV